MAGLYFPKNELQLFQRLVTGLRFQNRFSLDDETEKFVTKLLQYAQEHKIRKLPKHTRLFRGRIHEVSQQQPFNLEEMGPPKSNQGGGGRLNPTGIPYLYLSMDQLTCISEVRPWRGCKITIAEFILRKQVRLIDFSKKAEGPPADTDDSLKNAEWFWGEMVSWLFSAPFDPRDNTAYVPTQYLAERIKGLGFQGICYDSALHDDGLNVALFDVELAKPVSRWRATVTSVGHMEAKIRPVN